VFESAAGQDYASAADGQSRPVCAIAQERTSHGVTARPSQVIDSESISRQLLGSGTSRLPNLWRSCEPKRPQHLSIQALIGAHRPVETKFILQRCNEPSMRGAKSQRPGSIECDFGGPKRQRGGKKNATGWEESTVAYRANLKSKARNRLRVQHKIGSHPSRGI